MRTGKTWPSTTIVAASIRLVRRAALCSAPLPTPISAISPISHRSTHGSAAAAPRLWRNARAGGLTSGLLLAFSRGESAQPPDRQQAPVVGRGQPFSIGAEGDRPDVIRQ